MQSRTANRRSMELGEAIHIRHGFAFKSQYFSDNGQLVVLTPGNFNEGGGFRVRPDKDRFYSGAAPKEYILRKGDLIIAMTEQGPGLLGSSALVPHDSRYLHNQRLGLVDEIDVNALDKQFLYYLFNTRPVRAQLSGSATGTKVRHTAPERIYRVKVAVPADVKVQRRIASALRVYDDLIENNRRRIQLLEQQARLIYEEWFVRLRFPGHECVRIINGVPEDWEVKTLGDIARTNETSYGAQELPEQINYIDISSVAKGRIADKATMPSAEAPGRARRRTRSGDVIWSNVRPNLRAFALVLDPEENDVVSTGFTVLTPVEVPFSYLYLLVTTERFVSHLENHATGVSYPAVRPDDFERARVLCPAMGVLELFHETVEPVFRFTSILEREARRLQDARDLLLPRMMNGGELDP